MVCHRFCPQALAEALKVNKTITKIVLSNNGIGKEGAKAMVLGTGVCGSKPQSRVPVVFETCQTLVVLDRCSGVGRERGWRQDGSGAWEMFLQL